MRAVIRLVLAFGVLAGSGCLHAQTGPIVGVSLKQGPVVGWEAGAGAALLGATLGTELRPFGDQVAELYIAAEPAVALPLHTSVSSSGTPAQFVSLGGSAGLAVDQHGVGSHMTGGFGGAAWIRSGDCRERWIPTASVSVGVQVFIGDEDPDWTVYATPKLGALGSCPDFRGALGPRLQ